MNSRMFQRRFSRYRMSWSRIMESCEYYWMIWRLLLKFWNHFNYWCKSVFQGMNITKLVYIVKLVSCNKWGGMSLTCSIATGYGYFRYKFDYSRVGSNNTRYASYMRGKLDRSNKYTNMDYKYSV